MNWPQVAHEAIGQLVFLAILALAVWRFKK